MESFLFNITTFGIVLLTLVTIVFIVAQLKKDNSIMDIVYGPLFLVSGLCTFFITNTKSTVAAFILLAIAAWSLRLGLRIYRKNHGAPEDARYAAWRTAWSSKGHWYFLLHSYLQINILQGIIILLVSLPFIISLGTTAYNKTFLCLGLAVFILGLTIESVADYQLDSFIARKKAGTEPSNLMITGLFKFSRRPNYFGETLIWWGLAIIALPLPYGAFALLSPLLITYIVTKVTGPMLENIFIEKYGDEYRAYMKKTSYFVPLPPRD